VLLIITMDRTATSSKPASELAMHGTENCSRLFLVTDFSARPATMVAVINRRSRLSSRAADLDMVRAIRATHPALPHLR